MKKSDFPPEKPGRWINPRRKYYFMGCCDCGLVHKLEFRLIDSWHGQGKKIQSRAWRDEQKTTALRKRHASRGPSNV